MGSAIDLFVTYRFIKLLVTPFEKTDAYRLGIIDENGHRVMVTEPKRVGIVQRTVPKPLGRQSFAFAACRFLLGELCPKFVST